MKVILFSFYAGHKRYLDAEKVYKRIRFTELAKEHAKKDFFSLIGNKFSVNNFV